MKDTAKEKTAFSAGRGLWQFRVMPFCLCNAPATFERLMEQVLSGLQLSVALVYIDDILVPGKTFDDHLTNLRSVSTYLRSQVKTSTPQVHTVTTESQLPWARDQWRGNFYRSQEDSSHQFMAIPNFCHSMA